MQPEGRMELKIRVGVVRDGFRRAGNGLEKPSIYFIFRRGGNGLDETSIYSSL